LDQLRNLFYFLFFFKKKAINSDLSYFAASIVRTKLDASGVSIPESGVAAGYGYQITYRRFRSKQDLPFVDVSKLAGSPKITKIQTSAPSPPIEGSFTITYNGITSPDIPYNDDGTQLRKVLIESFLMSSDLIIKFGGFAEGDNSNGRFFQIYFYGTKGDVSDFTFDTTKLKGGATGTSPKVTQTEIVKGSNNLFFDPIPFDMLYTIGINLNNFNLIYYSKF
jgi:hypothetical protein